MQNAHFLNFSEPSTRFTCFLSCLAPPVTEDVQAQLVCSSSALPLLAG